MNKLMLFVRSQAEGNIDECMMIVPENYDRETVLDDAQKMGIGEPAIISVIKLADVGPFTELPADYRPYVG